MIHFISEYQNHKSWRLISWFLAFTVCPRSLVHLYTVSMLYHLKKAYSISSLKRFLCKGRKKLFINGHVKVRIYIFIVSKYKIRIKPFHGISFLSRSLYLSPNGLNRGLLYFTTSHHLSLSLHTLCLHYIVNGIYLPSLSLSLSILCAPI